MSMGTLPVCKICGLYLYPQKPHVHDKDGFHVPQDENFEKQSEDMLKKSYADLERELMEKTDEAKHWEEYATSVEKEHEKRVNELKAKDAEIARLRDENETQWKELTKWKEGIFEKELTRLRALVREAENVLEDQKENGCFKKWHFELLDKIREQKKEII